MKHQMGRQKATTEKIHDMVTLFDYLPTFFTGKFYSHFFIFLGTSFLLTTMTANCEDEGFEF